MFRQFCLPKMTLLYTRTLPLIPDEGPESRRPPPTSDTQKETRRVAEPRLAHPVRDTLVSCPHHTQNQHMYAVASAKPPPSFPKHPGTDAGEDPHHQKPRKCTVEHAHKALFPPCDKAEHDAPIVHRLIGAYRYDTCMYLCRYTPCRRCLGVDRGQLLTDLSPGTIPRICSPFPVLVASCPTPFKFAQESCFLFFLHFSCLDVCYNTLNHGITAEGCTSCVS